MARSCFILADYDAVNAYPSREVSRRALTQGLVREASRVATTPATVASQGLCLKLVFRNFYVSVPLAGIEPVGFRVKGDLRNHQGTGTVTAESRRAVPHRDLLKAPRRRVSCNIPATQCHSPGKRPTVPHGTRRIRAKGRWPLPTVESGALAAEIRSLKLGLY